MPNRFERYATQPEGGGNRFARYADAPPREPISRTNAVWRGAQDAFSFGFADEFAGLIGGNEERDRVRREQELARAYHPMSYMGGQLGGALAGGGGLGIAGRAGLRLIPGAAQAAGRFAQGIGPLGRIGLGAGAGAAGGALYGAGDSPDGMRGQGAAGGALWGAAFGAGGQALGEVGGRLAGALQRSMSPEARAANMIAGMQQRFGQTGDDLAAGLRDAPEGAMVMDVLPGGTQIAAGAGARPSAGREEMRKALDQRNAGASQQAVDDIWSSLGGGARQSGSATIDDMARQQRAQAAPLYEAALTRPMDMARAQALLQPIIDRNPRLFQLAQERAQAIALSETGRRFRPDDPRYWHYLKQGADEAFESLRNPVSGQGGLGPAERRAYARAMHAYRLQLGRILGPEYRQADAIWGGLARQQNAIRTGFDAVDSRADDMAIGETLQAMRRMSAGELDAMRLGALAKMTDMLENANTMTGRADPVRALIRSAGQRRVLETLFGGQKQFADVMRRLEQRQQLFRNSVESGIGVNSHTADRLLAYQSQLGRTNPTQGGLKDMALRVLTGDAADQYDEAVSNVVLNTLRVPARQALGEINAAGGVQQWAQGRGLLSRALRERQRLAQQRPRALASALTTGIYAPVIGGSGTDYIGY
jgi:hypothetical protein